MSNIQKQHKISPAIAWLTIQKFIIFYCPLDREHTNLYPGVFYGEMRRIYYSASITTIIHPPHTIPSSSAISPVISTLQNW